MSCESARKVCKPGHSGAQEGMRFQTEYSRGKKKIQKTPFANMNLSQWNASLRLHIVTIKQDITQVQINVSPLPLTDKVFSISCNTLYVLESKGLCHYRAVCLRRQGCHCVEMGSFYQAVQLSSAVPGDCTEGKATSADPQAYPWP